MKLELIAALNSAAAVLQKAAHSEQAVHDAFREQLAELGLRGGLTLLDPSGITATIVAMAEPRRLQQTLTRLQQLVGIEARGFTFVLADVDVYHAVVRDATVLHVADTSAVVAQLIPPVARRFAARVLQTFGSQPGIFAPLVGERGVFGLINIVGPDVTTEDVPVVQAFANHIAIALEDARLHESERAQRRLADALREVGRALAATVDFDQLLDQLLQHIARVVPYDAGNIMLIEGGRARIVRQRGYDRFGSEVKQMVAALALEVDSTPNLRRMVDTRQPLVVPDVAADPNWVRVGWSQIRSWAGAPIVVQGEVVALFSLDKTEPDFYTTMHAEHLAAFAGQASLALQNAQLFAGARQQAAEAETLRRASAAITATLDQDEAIASILEQLQRVVPYDSASVQLLRTNADGTRELELVGGRGWADPTDVLGMRFPVPGDNPNTPVIQQGRAHVLPDAPLAHAPFRTAPHSHIRSWLGVPLSARERVIGMLAVDHSQPDFYTPEHVRLALAFADQVAIVLENARLHAEAHRRAAEFEALYASEQRGREALAGLLEIAQVASSSLELRQVLKHIAQRTAAVCQVERCSVFLLGDEAKRLHPVMSQYADGHADPELWERFRVATADDVDTIPLMRDTVRERRPMVLTDPSRTDLLPRHWTEPFGIQSLLTVPLVSRERVIGLLALDHAREPAGFTPEQIDLATTIGGQVAGAITNARLYDQIGVRLSELGALYSAAQDLAESLEPEVVLYQLARHLAQALDASGANILKMDRQQSALTLLAEYETGGNDGGATPVVSRRVYSVQEYPSVRRALAEQQVISVHSGDDDLNEWERQLMAEYGLQTLLLVPLVTHGRVLGLAGIWDTRRRHEFKPGEMRLAQALGGHGASVIENVRRFESEQQQARRQMTLLGLSTELAVAPDEQSIAERVVRGLHDALGYDYVGLFMLDESTGERVCTAHIGWPDAPAEWRIAPGAGISERALRDRQLHYTPDVTRDPAYVSGGINTGAEVDAPLVVGERVLGVLIVESSLPHALGPADFELLQTAANLTAVALDKARLFAAERRRVTELDALRATLADITSELELEKLLQAVLERAMELLNATGGELGLFDEDTQALRIVVSRGMDRDYTGTVMAPSEGIMGRAAETHEPIRIDNYASWEGSSPQYDASVYHAALSAPIMIGDRLSGVIGLVRRESKRTFDQADENLLVLFARQAAIAVENARLFETVQQLAITDPLTGLHNRRYLIQAATREFQRAQRYGHPLSLLMLDIDHFKRVNDTYGHAAGDCVLQALAERAQRELRDIDLLARYGGEEFVVLLPESDTEGARRAAERLCECMVSEPVDTDAGPVTVSISVGLATLDDDCPDLTALLKRADQALYSAKGSGRNRVQVWEEVVSPPSQTSA